MMKRGGSFEDNFTHPNAVQGHQDDLLEVLPKVSWDEFQSELERRRNKDNKDNIVWTYCIVFPAKPPKLGLASKVKGAIATVKQKDQGEVDDERHAILKKIRDAGFVTERVYSSTKEQIICKIGCTDERLLIEAEHKEHKLMLHPKAVQHVLELKAGAENVTRPKQPVYLGYEHYDEETFDKIQHAGGDDALPLFWYTDVDPAEAENNKITLDIAKKTFFEQSRMDPFMYLHFKYDASWEERIIKEHGVQLYRSYHDQTILRNADRVLLTMSALQEEPILIDGVRGAGLDLKKLQFKKQILAYYPIQYSEQTRKAGDLTSEELYSKFLWSHTYFPWKTFLAWKQPIADIRDYAGEKIALYFAFLEFYSFWLLPAALFGLIVYAIQIGRLANQTGQRNIITSSVERQFFNLTVEAERDFRELSDEDIERLVLERPFTSERTPFARSINGDTILYNLVPTEIPLLIPLYALFVALWAAFFLEFWKRHQASLAYKWGVSDYERTAEVRPEFNSQYDVPHVVTGLPTPYRSPVVFGVKVGFSLSLVGSAVAVTVAAFAATYIFKAFMSQSDLDPTLATQIALILNAVAIMGLATIFKTVAKMLTDWENHRTDIEYEDMLIAKTFIFSFFNSYTTLIYFAFIKKGQDLPPNSQTQFCIAELQFNDVDNEDSIENAATDLETQLFEDKELIKVDSCYGALGYSLMIIFITQIFINNGMELGIPLMKRFMKNYFNVQTLKDKANQFKEERVSNLKEVANTMTGYHEGEEKAQDPEAYEKRRGRPLKSPGEVQFLLSPYDTPFYDFLELALQFGYVTLFVAAFPLAPTLALLNNCVEVFVDAQKVCLLSRRPNLPRAQDIGTWLQIFTILSYLAIIINSGVLLFTSVEIIPLEIENPENRVWCFLGFILGVFFIKYLTDFFVSDTPARITIQLERQKYIEQKIFYDDEDDTDKINMKIEAKEVKKLNEQELAAEKERDYEEFYILDRDPYLTSIVNELKERLKSKNLDEEKLFETIDVNHNEVIGLPELKKVLLDEELGLGKDMKPFAIKLVVEALDLDGDGKITKEELAQFLNDDRADSV